jgi:hypothetical protein
LNVVLQVSQDLRDLILQLYDRHLSPDGKAVNYTAMKSDPLFRQYVAATGELQLVGRWVKEIGQGWGAGGEHDFKKCMLCGHALCTLQ